MATAVLLPNGKQAYLNAAGTPAVGYKVQTYAAGTTTPKTTWQDSAETSANTNPIILDTRGEAVIFGDGVYKIQLQDAAGAVIWTVDNVTSGLFGITSNAAGQVFIGPPTSGIALTVTPFAGQAAIAASGSGATPMFLIDNAGYYGAKTFAAVITRIMGISAADKLEIGSKDSNLSGGTSFLNNNVEYMAADSNRQVFVRAPASGNAFNVAQNAGGNAINITAAAGSAGAAVGLNQTGQSGAQLYMLASTGTFSILVNGSDRFLITSTGLIQCAPGPSGELIGTNAALTTGAGAGAGTITNAPSAGNPTKWIKINDNGTIRAVPAW